MRTWVLILLVIFHLPILAEFCEYNDEFTYRPEQSIESNRENPENPFISSARFDDGIVNVYLDRRWNERDQNPDIARFMRGNVNEAVETLNEQLINIQLNIVETNEDLSLQGLIQYCSGLSGSALLQCIDRQREKQRVKYKDGIILYLGSNSGSFGIYCSDGSKLPCVNNTDTIAFGTASVLPSNINNYSDQVRVDVIRHELMHGLGLPHAYGPYQVQGIFEFQATATPLNGFSWKKYRVPNMDPVINRDSTGLKITDIQNLQDKYGKPDNKITLQVNLIQENNEIVRGMNVALLHKKRFMNKSTARSSYSGVSFLTTTKGKYYVLIRPVPVALNADGSSGVEGERRAFFNPTTMKDLYICSYNKKSKIYDTCSNRKSAKAIKLKSNKQITVYLNTEID